MLHLICVIFIIIILASCVAITVSILKEKLTTSDLIVVILISMTVAMANILLLY